MKKVWLGLFGVMIGMISMSCSANMKFEPSKKKVIVQGVEIVPELKCNAQTGVFDAEFRLYNGSKKTLYLEPQMTEIYASNGIMSQALPVQLPDKELLPGAKVNLKVKFKPINNPALYRRFDYFGDIHKKYELTLNFLVDENNQFLSTERVGFTVKDNEYRRYIKKYAVGNNIRVYAMEIRAGEFVEKQERYMWNNGIIVLPIHNHANEQGEAEEEEKAEHEYMEKLKESSRINISGDEIVFFDRVLKAVVYSKGNKWVLNFRLINQGEEIKIDATKFVIDTGKEKLKPLNTIAQAKLGLSGVNKTLDDSHAMLRRNDRIDFQLEYEGKELPERFTLSLEGLTTGAKNIRFMVDDLPFRREDNYAAVQ